MQSGTRTPGREERGGKVCPARGECSKGECSQDPPANKQECLKLVLSLNREVALYCQLVFGLGGSNDSDRLREELRRSRRRALELALQNKARLIPLLRNKKTASQDITQLERLYNFYLFCLEILEVELTRTVLLQRSFPLHSGTPVLINTGIVDPTAVHGGGCLSVEQLDHAPGEEKQKEQEELDRLERDLLELQELGLAVNQALAILPWDIEPEDRPTSVCAKSVSSSEDGSSIIEINATSNNGTSRSKCLRIALITIGALVVVASVVGLTVGLLNR